MPFQRSENQRKRKERQVFRHCQRTEKAMEYESDGNIDYNWCAWNDPQKLDKKAGRVTNRGRSGSIQITTLLRSARIPRRILDLGDLLIIQTPVRKTRQEKNNKRCCEVNINVTLIHYRNFSVMKNKRLLLRFQYSSRLGL